MLKADDIRAEKFKKGLFGYKPAEVDSFKETVFRAYEELNKLYEEAKEKNEKLTASIEETRLKLFDMENKLKNSDDGADAKRKADKIIKDAEAKAAEILANAKAKAQEPKVEAPKAEAPKAAPVKEEPVKESASSKFFKKAEDVAPAANEDDDEIFVGEIEDARKPDRMMIGDGEEEDAGFEFL